MLWLLTGDHRQGKTTTCRRLVERSRAAGVAVGGIVQPAVCAGGLCVGYDVLDVTSERSVPFAEIARGSEVVSVGRFRLSGEGLAFGKAALAEALRAAPRLLIVDEVGPLELSGGGWAAELDGACRRGGVTLLSVRRSLIHEVVQRWHGASEGEGPFCLDLNDGAEQVVTAFAARLCGSV
jgi:nucleoside-triphosphatase THEP1